MLCFAATAFLTWAITVQETGFVCEVLLYNGIDVENLTDTKPSMHFIFFLQICKLILQRFKIFITDITPGVEYTNEDYLY